jgi:hypothetical protein
MTEIRNTDGGAAYFTYTLTTVPDQVAAGATVQLTISVTDPAPANGTKLQSLTIEMPLGDGANQLCHQADMSPSTPSGWTMKPNTATGLVQFPYKADGNGATIPDGQSIQFVFTGVNINNAPGTLDIDLTENSSVTRNAAASVPLTKFPANWATTSFWVDPANISYGDSTTLNWSGPEGPSYSIQYTDPATNKPVNLTDLNNQGTYPGDQSLKPTLTTNFSLNLQQTINGQLFTWQLQKTVTVGDAQPQITSFTGVPNTTTSPRTINLSWTSVHTTYCELNVTPGTQPSNYNNFTAGPAVEYSLTGVLVLQDGTQLTDQQNRSLLWAPAGSLPGNAEGLEYGDVCLVMAPDNSRLYMADGAVWVLTPNDDDSNPVQQSTNLYIAANERQYTWVTVSPDQTGSLLYVAVQIYQGRNYTTEIQVFSASSLTQIGAGAPLPGTANVIGLAICTGSSGSYLVAAMSANPGDSASVHVFSITGDSSTPLQAFGAPLNINNLYALGTSPDGTRLLVLTSDSGGTASLMAYEPTGNTGNPLGGGTMQFVPNGSIDFAVAPAPTQMAAALNAQGQVTPFQIGSTTNGASSAPINNLVAVVMAPDGSRIYAVDGNETVYALVPSELVVD